MGLERDLSLTDRERVREALVRISARLNRNLTLSDILDEWRQFVVAVNQGYGWSMDTYNRDLAIRDVIEEICELLSMSGRLLVMNAVRDTDRDFTLATYDPDRPDENYSPHHEIGWWQFRIPKFPTGALLADFNRMGYKPWVSFGPPPGAPDELIDYRAQGPDS